MPEVSRNKNIGEVGANMNAATFRKFLNGIAWAQEPVTSFGGLRYLQKDAYEAAQAQAMAAAELWQGSFEDAHFEPGQVCFYAQHHMPMAHGSSLSNDRVSPPFKPASLQAPCSAHVKRQALVQCTALCRCGMWQTSAAGGRERPSDTAAVMLGDSDVTLRLPAQVYLRPYKLEEYEALVKPLKLWPFPRGHQRHLTMLPIRGATMLLADQRSCPLLPDSLTIRAHPGLRPTAAARATDCNLACRCSKSASLAAMAQPVFELHQQKSA